ncbi:hypothetical protein D9619_012878 [Psilocybe cf. subviscida]|uniref:Fungal-type protein kinase domain-containing protein n=1 Tax=Psilocybe cf. subviscida TaxID=2480587 RepID=A0A8H5BI20_9AGAR|nr:hypothetical protein D9619_012878 [Psilocybe cf. subviscida]
MPTFRNVNTSSTPDSPMVVDDPHRIIFGPPLPILSDTESNTSTTSRSTSSKLKFNIKFRTTSGSDTDTDLDTTDARYSDFKRYASTSKLLDAVIPQSGEIQRELAQHDRDRESEFFRFYQRKSKNVGLPRALMIFSRSRAGEVAPFPMPRIYQFADMIHLVRCFRDAVLDHRRMWMDGILHHDVTAYTILLGRVDAPVGLCGKLCKSKDPIYVYPLDPRAPKYQDDNEPHPDTKRLSFKSVMALSRLHEPDLSWPAEDHLDDMESLLYALAWIAGYMDGPQRLHLASDVPEWETRTPDASSSEKQSLLRAPMLTHVNTYFWRPAFWRMYTRLAEICMNRIHTKYRLARAVDRGEHDRFPTLLETRRHFGGMDHDRFLSVVDQAIAEMELESDDRSHVKPRSRPAFAFADLRVMSNTHQKRPRPADLSEEEELERQEIADMGRKLDKSAAETLGLPFPLLNTIRKTAENDASFNEYSPAEGTLKLPSFTKDLLLNITGSTLTDAASRPTSGSCCFDLAWRLGLLPGQPNSGFMEYDEKIPIAKVVTRSSCCCGRISRHGLVYLVSHFFQHASAQEIPGGGTIITINTTIGRFKCYEIDDRTFVHFDGSTRSSPVTELVANQDLDHILRVARGQYLTTDKDTLSDVQWNTDVEERIPYFASSNWLGNPNAIMYMPKQTVSTWKCLRDFGRMVLTRTLQYIDTLREPESFCRLVELHHTAASNRRIFKSETPPELLSWSLCMFRVMSEHLIATFEYELFRTFANQCLHSLHKAHQHYRNPNVQAGKMFTTSRDRFLRMFRTYCAQESGSASSSHGGIDVDAMIESELQSLMQTTTNNIALVVYQAFIGITVYWNAARMVVRSREVPVEWIRFVSSEDDYIYLG